MFSIHIRTDAMVHGEAWDERSIAPRPRRSRALVLGFSIVLFGVGLPGCGSDEFKLAPVSGHVKVDGQPVEGLRIAFEPAGSASRKIPGPEAVGITDEEGRFKLATMSESPRNGAVVGPCRVRVWTLPPGQEKDISDDRSPDYDPVKEIAELKKRIRAGARKAAQGKYLPLRYNDKTELTFEVPAGGTDKADFDLSWK